MASNEHIDGIDVGTTNNHVHIESHGPNQVVANKSCAQDVKKVVDALKQRHIDSAQCQSTMLPPSVNRPWGTYTTLKEESCYKVKRITALPGQSLSLQYNHCAEHWTVMRSQGKVQIGDTQYPTGSGEARYRPLEEKHRLTKTGEEELLLIEVQVGDYLGEDDSLRLQDKYGSA